MTKPISTRTHGVLDYLTAGTLCALPRLLRWNEPVTRLLTGAALGTVTYSVLTRYELGLLKVLPMQAHLAFDGMSGAMLCGAPLVLGENSSVKRVLLGLGMFEIGASLMTRTTPAD